MKDMPSRIADAMYRQIRRQGFAAPVDVLMDIGVRDKTMYDDWCAGQVPLMEAVCVYCQTPQAVRGGEGEQELSCKNRIEAINQQLKA